MSEAIDRAVLILELRLHYYSIELWEGTKLVYAPARQSQASA